jgi:hypothetical protein
MIDLSKEHWTERIKRRPQENLMGRFGKGPHGWTSRDYNIEVPCKRTTCPANRFGATTGTCGMPSAIVINASGLCQTGQDLIDARPPLPPRKPDGD